GGLDICDSRWDTRAHLYRDPARLDVHERPYKAFHDIQVAVRGPVVKALTRFFCDSWRHVRDDQPVASEPAASQRVLADPTADAEVESEPADRFDLRRLIGGCGLPLGATRVGLSRTDIVSPSQPATPEVQTLFERAILGAERLLYIETHYFTSRAITEVLCRRLADPA